MIDSMEKVSEPPSSEGTKRMTLKGVSILLSAFLTVVISALMLYFTNSIPSFGEWYSYDQTPRLQTEAFLRGELAIQPVPYAHRHDTSWGNGLHQVWWLGVPILKLPFEIVAKLLGSFGFPDRLHFLIFYMLVAAIFWRSLNLVINTTIDNKEHLGKWTQGIPIIFFILLNPTFITMMYSKFGPYEEVIAYGYLWAFLIFALLLMFIKNRSTSLYLLICFLAGFSPNIRPTIGTYGFVTFLMAFYFAYNRPVRFRLGGFLLFLIGPLFILVTNYFRFGNPLEFGHSLALTGSPLIDYAIRFENPLKWPPFKDVALELLSALFFVDLKDLYVSNKGLLWQVDIPRMREFNFKPYDSTTLVLLLLSWISIALIWAKRNKDAFCSTINKNSFIMAGALWSVCSFIILFYYYSRYPAIAARHLVDFGPAFALGIVILYLYIVGLIKYILPDKFSLHISIIATFLFLVWIFISLSNIITVPLYEHLSKAEKTNVTNSEGARLIFDTSRRTSGPPLPDKYRCGDQETRYDILYNNVNWDTPSSCMVSLVTTHFLDNTDCLALSIESIDEAPAWLKKIYPDDEIVVKMGLEKLHRSSEIKQGRGKIITFCSDKKSDGRNAGGQQFKLISIAWGDLRKHPGVATPPFRLLSLEKVR